MGPPLCIINETKKEMIIGTGSYFHDSQLAHALSVFQTLIKTGRWLREAQLGGISSLLATNR